MTKSVVSSIFRMVCRQGFLSAIVWFIACGQPGRSGPGFHLLLITLDTTRADHLGCYGYPKNTTPELDLLAGESTTFDMAIAQAAVTPVSHASILTGLNPYHHGLRVLHGRVANTLKNEQTTLAEVWHEAGGETAAFVSAFPVTESFGLDQGFDHFDAVFPEADGNGLVDNLGAVNTGLSQRRADETTRAAASWLHSRHKNAGSIFMWVHYFDPHDPYRLPPQPIINRFPPESESRADILRAFYDAEIYYMDYQVGRLLTEFRDANLWDRTIVVIVGDHGEGLGDHNWWSHGILYQEEIRVPLIVRVPGIPGGSRVSSLVRTIDIVPTVLEAASVPNTLWPIMDGSSLVKCMRLGSEPAGLRAFSGSVNILNYGRPDLLGNVDKKDDKLYCLTDGRQKLIYHQLHPDSSEFYLLDVDPGETENLWESAPSGRDELLSELVALGAFSDILPGMTESDLQRFRHLKELGYLEESTSGPAAHCNAPGDHTLKP